MRIFCRRARHNITHHHSIPIQGSGVLPVDLGLDPKITANNSPLFQQTLHRHLHRVGGNGETDALRTAGAGDNRRIYANHFTRQIDERPTTVAWIDSGIGLQKIAKAIDPIWTPFRANNALRDCFLEAEWISDRENHVARLHRVGIAELQRLHRRFVNFQNG